MMGWEYLWILAAVSALFSAAGFYKYIYFISVGYGLAVAGIGAALLLLFGGSMAPAGFVLCALLVLYGARLSGFLLYRESRIAAYRDVLGKAENHEHKIPLWLKPALWLNVALLYVLQTGPVFYRLYNRAPDGLSVWIGAALMALGLSVETLADIEKNSQKKTRPDMVAMRGLYRIVRCPNYLGEILFWTGVFISGFGALNSIGQWVFAAGGYIGIVMIMFSGAARLEKRQEKQYGSLSEYRNYADSTPIILPLVPLYHIAKKDS